MSYTLHVISHTHWDREWYLSFEQFRLKLVDLIDNLLDLLDTDPDFKYFNLDGQAIILEDYLQIRPENRERLKEHISSGRITIGPWYVLNDEFLVSGESTVRSLLIGHKVVREFGPVMKVGYLPDQFGNISQMPQILRNFGIDNCIFGRGYQLVDGRTMEFDWKSPDGSSVTASLMALWYNNAQHIPSASEGGRQYINGLVSAMKPLSGSRHLLLMNGVDHLEAQYGLSQALRSLEEQPNEHAIVHSNLPAYVDALRQERRSGPGAAQEFEGELREDRGGSILAGVLSTRIYLKQANERCQRLLERYAEPLACMASMAGQKYPAGELDYAWKLLMENHPHDSICGCSIDEVHSEMMARFAKVEQLASELRRRSLDYITNRIDAPVPSLAVFNTLTWPRTGVVRASVEIPIGDPARDRPSADHARDWQGLTIQDQAGNEVPYTLLSSQKHAVRRLHPEDLPMAQWVRRFEIEFVAADVPPMGYSVYTLHQAHLQPRYEYSKASQPQTTGFVLAGAIADDPGSIDLAAVGNAVLSMFEDGGDVGDEYNYRKPDQDLLLRCCGTLKSAAIDSCGPDTYALRFDYDLRLPEAASPDGFSRSDRYVVCPAAVTLRVAKPLHRIELEIEVDNQAKDHRLRLVVPVGDDCATRSIAGGAFDAVLRSPDVIRHWDSVPPPSPFFPMDGWVDVSGPDQGMAVLVDGLKEHELLQVPGAAIAVTLLRAVGRLSGGLETPDSQPTPGAQCIGASSCRIALYPHTGIWSDAQVWKQALEQGTPLAASQLMENPVLRSIENFEKSLPPVRSFAQVSPVELVPSALKAAESGEGYVLRFYNISDDSVDGRVIFSLLCDVWLSNMAEEPLRQLASGTEEVQVTARRGEIVTLILRPTG